MARTAALRWIGAMLIAALLSGCGGDGGSESTDRVGGSSTSEQLASFPVEAVFMQVATVGVSVGASAVEGSNRWALTWTTSPAARQVFNGVDAQQYVGDFTIERNGVLELRSTGLNFFTTRPYAPLGLVLPDGSHGVQTLSSEPLPALAVVGARGSLGTMTVYRDAQKSEVLNTQEATWSLQASTSSTAFLCTHTTAKSPSGDVLATSTGCFKVNSMGAVLGAKWTLALNGKSLTFQ